MADGYDAGAPAVTEAPEAPTDGLPEALTLPVKINVRNADQKIDSTGKASHLDGTALAAVIPNHVAVGTVLFTTLFLDSINTAARGLARVRSSQTAADGESCEIVADWVDLNSESRAKIERVLSGGGPMLGMAPSRGPIVQHSEQLRQFDPVSYQHGVPHTADMAAPEPTKRYFEPAPYRAVGKPTTSTKFWGSLGVTAYVAAALIILALFPVTRKIELQVAAAIWWGITRLFYWASHINQVRLYNNT